MGRAPKVVLLVEDDAILGMGMALELSRRGYSVKQARDRESAMAAYGAGVDLVVMDIDLGEGADGVSIAREMLGLRPAPIVFHCASPYSDHADRLEGLDYTAYIEKDIDQERLYRRVDRVLGRDE